MFLGQEFILTFTSKYAWKGFRKVSKRGLTRGSMVIVLFIIMVIIIIIIKKYFGLVMVLANTYHCFGANGDQGIKWQLVTVFLYLAC